MALLLGTFLCLALERNPVKAASGTVEILLPSEAAGVEMTVYRIADYDSEAQVFTLCGVFESCGVSLGNPEDARQVQNAAEQLAALAGEKGAQGEQKTADASGAVRFTDLAPGYYLIAQTGGQEYMEIQKTLVPVPYTAEDGSLVYDAQVTPKYTIPDGAAILNKVDDAGGTVARAGFVLQKKVYVSDEGELPTGAETGQDVDGRFFWEEIQKDLITNANGQLALTNLSFGVYRLTEISAPEGYILETVPCYFSIEKAGEVKEISGLYTPASGKVEELTVVNRQTSVKVNKVDKNGKPVAGAKLVVKSAADGSVVKEGSSAGGGANAGGAQAFTFVTTEEPYDLKRLPAGEYLLSEVEAPEGYKVSEDVPFTVEDGVDSVNEVTMVDEKEEQTKCSLSVTKRLVDQHEWALMAEEDTFYVALFADEERTRRISGVQALHYQGSSSETVTFSNLEADRTYYVGETDEFGILMEAVYSEDGAYAPVYPGSYAVTPTQEDGQKEYAFENMFYDLPWGYTYAGNLTITKKVLKGTKPWETKETFYAGVFNDTEHTDRYGDVIALSMEGGSEVSVTVPVYVGMSENDSAVYYVAETDENGNVLGSSSGLEYRVSVDKSEIVLSPGQSEGEVTITNTYSQDTPDLPSGNTGVREGSSSSGESRASAARTGDSSPIVWYAVLLAMALAALAAGAAWKKAVPQRRNGGCRSKKR